MLLKVIGIVAAIFAIAFAGAVMWTAVEIWTHAACAPIGGGC